MKIGNENSEELIVSSFDRLIVRLGRIAVLWKWPLLRKEKPPFLTPGGMEGIVSTYDQISLLVEGERRDAETES